MSLSALAVVDDADGSVASGADYYTWWPAGADARAATLVHRADGDATLVFEDGTRVPVNSTTYGLGVSVTLAGVLADGVLHALFCREYNGNAAAADVPGYVSAARRVLEDRPTRAPSSFAVVAPSAVLKSISTLSIMRDVRFVLADAPSPLRAAGVLALHNERPFTWTRVVDDAALSALAFAAATTTDDVGSELF